MSHAWGETVSVDRMPMLSLVSAVMDKLKLPPLAVAARCCFWVVLTQGLVWTRFCSVCIGHGAGGQGVASRGSGSGGGSSSGLGL